MKIWSPTLRQSLLLRNPRVLYNINHPCRPLHRSDLRNTLFSNSRQHPPLLSPILRISSQPLTDLLYKSYSVPCSNSSNNPLHLQPPRILCSIKHYPRTALLSQRISLPYLQMPVAFHPIHKLILSPCPVITNTKIKLPKHRPIRHLSMDITLPARFLSQRTSFRPLLSTMPVLKRNRMCKTSWTS